MEKSFKLYRLARTHVQLISVSLEEVHTKKFSDLRAGAYNIKADFSTDVHVKNNQEIHGFLKTVVSLQSSKNEVDLEMIVVHKGVFRSSEIQDIHSFENWVNIQIVPQLLPYARAFINFLSTQLKIPSIELPTMDILQSMKDNHQVEDENDV